ncbi:MAG TPA: IclR family transcriptional regulator [Pseudonocardia sp.]|jgi:DNA-binding IclR family transcriptional regulator
MTETAVKFEGAETARRAVRLLEIVATAPGPVRLAELEEAAGLSKSTCYRLVRVLQDELFLERQESGGYRVGSRMVGMAAAVLPRATAYAAALPTLRALAAASGETATLHVRAGSRSVLVLGAESAEQVVRRAARIGESTRLGRGASGLAILAQLPADDAERVTAGADDPAGVRVELDGVRADGYALSFGANHPGVAGIAAPVLGTVGRPAADGAPLSAAVSGPADRWTGERMRAFAPRLLAACDQLSGLFGDPS